MQEGDAAERQGRSAQPVGRGQALQLQQRSGLSVGSRLSALSPPTMSIQLAWPSTLSCWPAAAPKLKVLLPLMPSLNASLRNTALHAQDSRQCNAVLEHRSGACPEQGGHRLLWRAKRAGTATRPGLQGQQACPCTALEGGTAHLQACMSEGASYLSAR